LLSFVIGEDMHSHLHSWRRWFASFQMRCVLVCGLLGILTSCSNGGSAAATIGARSSSLESFNDCANASDCSDMIKLPGGSYIMGSPKSEPGRFDDEDQHQVSVATFAIARAPVTRREWGKFVRETGRPTPQEPCAYAPTPNPTWIDPGFPQNDDHPVVCVTWNDAQAYVAWLSKRTGKHYRLPTDEEWEYAARAGTGTPFYWGSTASHTYANYGLDKCCAPAAEGPDKWEYTSPVGSFPPNSFGLVDMAGNVFEWVQTCADAFEKLPLRKDGHGCTYRYARGGAYGERPAMMRSAAKNFAPPDDKVPIEHYRSSGFGFRVARDL
jgi:formylglycine-generating enzyme required for sulfatase activity